MRQRDGSRAVAAVPWVSAVVGVALVLHGTSPTAMISPDSGTYLSMAENIAGGRGFLGSITHFAGGRDHAPNSFWPPLYPSVLAGGRVLGLSLDACVRACNALAFAGSLLLLARTARLLDPARAPATEAWTALAALFSVPLVHPALWAWSDSLALLLGTACVHASLRSLEGEEPRRTRWLAAAAAALAAATLVRYAAVLLGIALLPLLLRGRPGDGARWRVRVLLAGAAALVPLSLWFLRNTLVVGRATYGEPRAWELVPGLALGALQAWLADFFPLPRTTAGAALLGGVPPRTMGAAGTLLLAAVLLAAGLLRRPRPWAGVPVDPRAPRLLAGSAILAAGIAITVVVKGGNPEIRYFAPCYALALPALVVLARGPASSPSAAEGAFRPVLLGTLAAWTALATTSTVVTVEMARRDGGFSRPGYLEAPSRRFLRSLEAPRIATDNDLGIWYLTRRPVRHLPPESRPDQVRDLVDGAFDGILAVHRDPHRWNAFCVRLATLERAGIDRRWERIGEFPDCVVFRRRE